MTAPVPDGRGGPRESRIAMTPEHLPMEPPMDMLTHVREALSAAALIPDEGHDLAVVHARRSRNFVESLAGRLRAFYHDDPEVAVLSKGFSGNQERFGLEELLYDILVCRTAQTPSARGWKQLTVITRGIMAIESELAPSSRQAMYDFNKLVLSAAEYKVFVGPQVANERAFLAPLAKAAACCSGIVFAFFIPHPSEWAADRPLVVRGHLWRDGAWDAL